MTISTNSKVNDFLSGIQSISPEQFDILISTREIFLRVNATIVEDIKYGGLVFTLSNTLIGGIYIYKHHISVEFSHGADLTDSDSFLEGKGKKRRHLKLYEKNDIVQKNVAYFVKQTLSQ